MKNNLAIAIANSVWILTIGIVIIFTKSSILWLLLPVFANWSFIKENNKN